MTVSVGIRSPLLCLLALACMCWGAHAQGTQPFAVTGAVTDVEGAPVSDAAVWATQYHRVQESVTDAHGRFAIEGLSKGPLDITVRMDGYATGGLSVVAVGPDDVQIELTDAAAVPLRIIDGHYMPAAGARIKSLVVNGAFRIPLADLTSHGYPSPRSERNGALTLLDMPSGGYVSLVLSHRDFADTHIPYMPTGNKEPQPVQLYPGVDVRGRVTNSAGQGVRTADICIFQTTDAQVMKPTWVTTDSEGFYVARVRPTPHYVAADHPQYAAADAVRIDVRLDRENTQDIVLPDAHPVRGSVTVPEEDRPMGGIWVAYVDGERIEDRTLTDNAGQFELKAPAGEGAVRVYPPDGYIHLGTGEVKVVIEDVPEISLQPFELRALPEIQGRVLDPEGNPAQDVLVKSEGLQPAVFALTDEEGRFHIRLDRAPFQKRAQFQAEHAKRFWRKQFEVDFSDEPEVEVTLEQFEPDLRANNPGRTPNDLESLVDEPAPPLMLDGWISGEETTLAQLQGKVVVLLFWGGFIMDGPARDVVEEVRALHALLREEEDVAIIGVHDSSVTIEDARDYTAEHGITFPVAYDKETADTFDSYDVTVLPQVVLIDKEGVLRYYDVEGRILELVKALRR